MKQPSKEALLLLAQLFEACEAGDGTVLAARFRADHSDHLDLLDQLVRDHFIKNDQGRYRVDVTALPQLDVPTAKHVLEQAERLWAGLRNHYRLNLEAQTTVEDLATACGMTSDAAQHALRYMLDVPWYGGRNGGGDKPIESIAALETVLKHTTFLSVIEEVLAWNSISPPSFVHLSQATDQADARSSVSERQGPTLPEWLPKLPDTAQVLMREVHLAMDAELYALSAMGIRAVVDVVSQDKLRGDAGSFAAKLRALRDAGHMAQVQYDAMVAVVDVGNAAAHRGHKPTPDSVWVMLNALEHLLQSLYVLTDTANELSRVTPKRTPGHRPEAVSSAARQKLEK